MDYRTVDLWKKRGFIQARMTPQKQLDLSRNLTHAKTLLNCYLVLDNMPMSFYSEIESVLYPATVYLTEKENEKAFGLIGDFISFCKENINIKYFFEEYNKDYELIQEFLLNLKTT